jgi:hypothetical protein
MEELTPWFFPKVNPEKIGVYQVHDMPNDDDLYFSYFDGEKWHGGWTSIDRAYTNREHPDTAPGPYKGWRGLASDPNARNMEVDRHEDDTDNWW